MVKVNECKVRHNRQNQPTAEVYLLLCTKNKKARNLISLIDSIPTLAVQCIR